VERQQLVASRPGRCGSSRATASPSRARPARRRRGRGRPRRHARDSADSLPVCTTVVLLVDHDQAEVGDRREDGAAGTDDQIDVAPPDALPLIVALAVAEAAVLDRDPRAERGAEDRRRRRRQRDLRAPSAARRVPTPAPRARAAGRPRSCRCR
jgi:hypothetical protein